MHEKIATYITVLKCLLKFLSGKKISEIKEASVHKDTFIPHVTRAFTKRFSVRRCF